MTIVLLNWICWGILAVVWVIGTIYDFYKAPSILKRRFRFDLVIAVLLVWLIVHYIPHHYWTFMTFRSSFLQVIGATLLVIFTFFTVWARWVLGKMWAAIAVVKENHQLRTDGPYRITRHPIYSGILGMLLGSTLLAGGGSIVLGFIIAVLFFANRIHIEEQLMIDTFGHQYVQYKERVPQVIPGLRFRNKKLHK